jgi:hypothetical protein
MRAETFAAIEMTITVFYKRHESGKESFQDIPGLLVIGKGVKPLQNTLADLKGMRFNQEGLRRSVNLTRNEVCPYLSSLAFVKPDSPIGSEGVVPPLTTFENASMIAELLQCARSRGSELIYYLQGDTLETVLAKCAEAIPFHHKWLMPFRYEDIGFSKPGDPVTTSIPFSGPLPEE